MEALLPSDPEKVGSFTLVNRLGSGGMGVVYLAKRGLELVALKVPNSAFVFDSSARERFSREAESLQQVESPRISRLVDWSGSAKEQWLAMEFINGPNLRELVTANGPFTFDEWLPLARGLLEALSEFHSKQIIHRDIKPGNIVISERGPVVIDLGISQMIDATRLTRTGGVEGSPAWLAPEQLESEKYGVESDVFSLGSVLVFAGRGSSPWGNDETLTVPVVFSRILNQEPILDDLNQEQVAILSKMLIKNPKNRATAGDLLKEIDQLEPPKSNEGRRLGPGEFGSGRNGQKESVEASSLLGRNTVGTKRLPRLPAKGDLEKTERLAPETIAPERAREPKLPAHVGKDGRLSNRRKNFAKVLTSGASLLALVGAGGLLLTEEPEESVSIRTLSVEWLGGSLYLGYSPDNLLQDYYTISDASISRLACVPDAQVETYKSSGIEPVFQVSEQLAGSGYQWLNVSRTQFGETSCPIGFGSVTTTLDKELLGDWGTERCRDFRYFEPESAVSTEREELWCISPARSDP